MGPTTPILDRPVWDGLTRTVTSDRSVVSRGGERYLGQCTARGAARSRSTCAARVAVGRAPEAAP